MSPVSVWTPATIPSEDSPVALFGVSVWPGASAWNTDPVPVSAYTPCEVPVSTVAPCDVPVSTWTKKEV